MEIEEDRSKESESTLANLRDSEGMGGGGEEGGALQPGGAALHHVLRIEEKRAVIIMSSQCLIKMASPEVRVRCCWGGQGIEGDGGLRR